MSAVLIQQAIYGSHDAGGYRFLARSPGFLEEWLSEVERLCTGFGDRPAGVACPSGVFAGPLGPRHVAVVEAADQGADDTGRPGALGFRVLVLELAAYQERGGDPFLLAETFPPPWQARGELPVLTLSAEPPRRTVEQVQQVLDHPDGPTLLGAAQVLVNGGRLVFPRPAPATDLLRRLWLLLPTGLRGRLWPASFAFRNTLGFHAVVLPRPAPEECADCVTEEQAGDYPEGSYELNVQTAAENGDQEDLDALFATGRPKPRKLGALFAGRSRIEIWLIGLIGLGLMLIVPLFFARLPQALPRPDLPEEEKHITLSDSERQDLTQALQALAKDLGMDVPPGATAEELLDRLDRHLGQPDPKRSTHQLAAYGPVKLQLRALLWKNGVERYNDRGLNSVELVERLRKKVIPP